MAERASCRASTFHLHSAFRIPHSAFGWGGEVSHGGGGPRRPSHARARTGGGAARRGARCRTAAGGRRTRHRGRAAAAPLVSAPPPADRADLPAHLVAQRALAVPRAPRVAGGGRAVTRGTARARDRHGWLRRGTGRVARAAGTHPPGTGRGERLPRAHHAL